MSPHATSGLSSLNTTRNNKVTHVASIGSGDGSDSPRVLTASRFVSVTQELGNPVNPVKSYEHKVSGKGSSSLSPLRRELSSPQSGSTAPTTTDKSTVPAPAKRRFLFGRTFQTATPPTHSQDDSYLYAGAKDPSTPPSHLSKSVSSVPSEINSHSKQPTTRASKSLRRQRSRAVKNEIDTKEYQLKRLSDQQENARYMDEDFITELKFEIDKLKIEFLDLTGTAYDEVKSASRSLYRRGRRYFSSGTRAGSKRAIDEAMAQRLQDRLIDTRYDKDTDVYDESMFERVSTPGHIPSHWGLPTR